MAESISSDGTFTANLCGVSYRVSPSNACRLRLQLQKSCAKVFANTGDSKCISDDACCMPHAAQLTMHCRNHRNAIWIFILVRLNKFSLHFNLIKLTLSVHLSCEWKLHKLYLHTYIPTNIYINYISLKRSRKMVEQQLLNLHLSGTKTKIVS